MNSSYFKVKYWQDKLYQNCYDPAQELFKKLDQVCSEDKVVLDLGAGAGAVNSYDLKGRCKKIYGVDFDPRVKNNHLLDEGIQIVDEKLPFEDNSIDIIFSIYVFEHVANPQLAVQELDRVLKPGGYIFALTPNKWHYVSLVAAMTPTRFHKWVNKKRGFSGDDTFPTTYKLNTENDIKKYFGEKYEWNFSFFETQPNYLKFNTGAFLAGVAYERIVNQFESLTSLRVNMVAQGHKANSQ